MGLDGVYDKFIMRVCSAKNMVGVTWPYCSYSPVIISGMDRIRRYVVRSVIRLRYLGSIAL